MITTTHIIICALIILAEYYILHLYHGKRMREKTRRIKSVEAQLIQMDKMASIGTLAAGIAHEINNPLGFLVSNLECLRGYINSLPQLPSSGSRDNPLLIEDLKAIGDESLEGALRIKRIVSDLRTFSRQSAETGNVQIDINQILESTLSIIWNEIKYKISLVKDYQAKSPIFADPTQLSQVFLNLIINASQAILEKGTITINTFEDAGNVFVKLSDTGSGIDKDVLPKIFEPFFSTKNSSGLGLSVSYNIIKRLNGWIKAESQKEKGTVFTVSFPKKQ